MPGQGLGTLALCLLVCSIREAHPKAFTAFGRIEGEPTTLTDGGGEGEGEGEGTVARTPSSLPLLPSGGFTQAANRSHSGYLLLAPKERGTTAWLSCSRIGRRR
jgi:hypothetical protein